MQASRVRCMLVAADGLSRRVGHGGLIIGRNPDCDFVASDPTVSRRHALVHLTADGAEVVPLGRAPIQVNGKKVERARTLANGDVVGVPGLELTVELEAAVLDLAAATHYWLERRGAASFGITHTPFAIGGGDTADLIVKRWPERALVFHLAGGELFVEVTAGTAKLNGVTFAPETVEPLKVGDELIYRREAFVVDRRQGREATTVIDAHALPTRVKVEMLPRGGRVSFEMPDGDHAVFLADRRLDLVIALLRPPAGHRAGDFIPDDLVRSIVWPRNPEITRPEINMLISRCRRDLVQAGLAGPRLLERAPGGGGTRFALAPGAPVEISS